MLGYRTSLALAGALVAGLLVGCPPAQAGYREHWRYDVRPEAMPTSDDPARTIESATGFVSDGESAYATVTLGAEPGGSAAVPDVHLVFGTRDEVGGCVAVSEIVTPASSRTVSLGGAVAVPLSETRCSYVALTESGSEVVRDRLDGRIESVVIVDPPSPLRIGGYRHRELPVNRWSWVQVRIDLDRPADVLRVSSRAPDGVRTRQVVERDLAAGRVSVRIPVKLLQQRDRRLVLRASTSYASATSSVRLEPRR